MSPQGKTEAPITQEELARTPLSNETTRQQLASEVEAFLAKGGSVNKVERGFRADPPQKPENKYGSRPI